MPDPRSVIEKLKSSPTLPKRADECFTGYVVMGLTFRSGHVLGLRKWAASSIGPAYTAVWHRSPDDEWTTYSDLTPQLACSRYIGAQLQSTHETRIIVTWPEEFRLHIAIPEAQLEWDIEVAPTLATRFMNSVARIIPQAAWGNKAFLSALSRVVGPILGAAVITLRPEALRVTGVAAGAIRLGVNGLILLLVILFLPNGLLTVWRRPRTA